LATAIAGAAGGNVTGTVDSLIQNTAIYALQSLAVTQVKRIADGFGSKDEAGNFVPTGQSEVVRGLLQGFVGCAGAAAANGSCGSGAAGAAGSVALNNLITLLLEPERKDPTGRIIPRSLDEQQARAQLIATLTGALVGALGGNANDASVAGQVETENNLLGPCGTFVGTTCPKDAPGYIDDFDKPKKHPDRELVEAIAKRLGFDISSLDYAQKVLSARIAYIEASGLGTGVIKTAEDAAAYSDAFNQFLNLKETNPQLYREKLILAGGNKVTMLKNLVYENALARNPIGHLVLGPLTNWAALNGFGNSTIFQVGGINSNGTPNYLIPSVLYVSDGFGQSKKFTGFYNGNYYKDGKFSHAPVNAPVRYMWTAEDYGDASTSISLVQAVGESEEIYRERLAKQVATRAVANSPEAAAIIARGGRFATMVRFTGPIGTAASGGFTAARLNANGHTARGIAAGTATSVVIGSASCGVSAATAGGICAVIPFTTAFTPICAGAACFAGVLTDAYTEFGDGYADQVATRVDVMVRTLPPVRRAACIADPRPQTASSVFCSTSSAGGRY
jgi:hypothetical protein